MKSNRSDKLFDDFVIGTVNQVTLSAALRRSNTYTRDASSAEKKTFRNSLSAILLELSEQYHRELSEQEHIRNIRKLQSMAEKKHHSLLRDGRLRFGVAQKALNLYLKLLWSLGRIPEPPHCPIDSIIIGKLDGKYKSNWTEMDNARAYRSIMNAIRKMASEEHLSVAQWELKEFRP